MINMIDDIVYVWKTGSEHSITRIGVEQNNGVPLYSHDLCMVGSCVASINAILSARRKNPFSGNITRFTAEQMVGLYFTYVESLERSPMFSKQNWFNAKRFYRAVYKDIEQQIDDNILKQIYTAHYAGNAQNMIGIIPQITFFEFMDKIRTEEYRGRQEWNEIRAELPQWVIDLDLKSGVLGEQNFIPYDGEE